MNIVEKLKKLGVEITSEIEKAFDGEFISEKEVEKKLAKVQAENETLSERLKTAEDTLKGFEGKNFDEITKERDEWKKKAEETEKEYSEKEAKREFDNILKETIAELNGKNDKAILANLDIEALMKSRNQKDDIKKSLEALKNSEETSFLFADKQETLKITTSTMNNNSKGGVLTKKDIDNIKDTSERQKAIAESIARGDGIYR